MTDPSLKALRPRHLKRCKFMKEVNCNVLSSSLFLSGLEKNLSLFSDLASLHNPMRLCLVIYVDGISGLFLFLKILFLLHPSMG